MKRKDDEDGNALRSVIQPLIDGLAPKAIAEPKTKLGQLIRALIREHLGDKMYASILDRFIIDSCEKDPKETFDKIRDLNVALSNIVYEIEEEGEKKTDESVQEA